MRELIYKCPVCFENLEQISEHLEATKTQPEFEAQFWCGRCQDYVYESEVEKEE